MRHGFISAAVGSPELRAGGCAFNLQSIMSVCSAAAENRASVLLLPPMCITGPDCGDLLYHYDLLEQAVDALLELCELTEDMNLLVFAGLPLPLDGKLYNCMAAVLSGKILGIVPENADIKRTMLTIEGMHVPFGSDLMFSCLNVPALTVGVAFSSRDTERLAALGATLIVCAAAPVSIAGAHAKEKTLCLVQSEMFHAAVLHSGIGVVTEDGVLLAEARRFTPSLAVSEIDVELIESVRRKDKFFRPEPRDYIPFALEEHDTALTRYISPQPFAEGDFDEMFMLASHALARRIKHFGSKCAVLGLSGGLDSTLAALIAANAMSIMNRPPSDVLAVLMPGYATGSRTSSNARELSHLMGFTVREIDIRRAVTQHLEDIGHKGEKDVVYENAQARERTQILLDIANAENGAVIGTGDMSELAMGFCTYGGDALSHFGVNADIPKTLARSLVMYAASGMPELREVLTDIVDTPITPELLPEAQLTEEILGSYEMNDFFLYYTLRYGFSREKIVRLAECVFEDKYGDLAAALDRFYKRFYASQFKRVCQPDIARISRVSLADFKCATENSWG